MRTPLKRKLRDWATKDFKSRLEYLKSKLGKRNETNQMKYIKYHLRKRGEV